MGTRVSQETTALWEAQGKCCAICGREMSETLKFDETCGWTIEHVYHHASKRYLAEGNKLVSHASCNNAKGDREPTGCEIIMLHAVNAQLGYELTERPLRYDDQIRAPSILAVKLARMLEAA